VSDLVLALTLLGVLLAAAAFVILLFILRRYLLTRDLGSFDCSLGRETDRDAGGGWMLGVARFQGEHAALSWPIPEGTGPGRAHPGQLKGPPKGLRGVCFKNCSVLKLTPFPFLLPSIGKGIILRKDKIGLHQFPIRQ